jgi:hypothetical protein
MQRGLSSCSGTYCWNARSVTPSDFGLFAAEQNPIDDSLELDLGTGRKREALTRYASRVADRSNSRCLV